MNLGRAFGDNLEPQRPPRIGQRPLARQIVSLAFLSDQLPASLITRQLAGSLRTETNASVILVRFATEAEMAGSNGGAHPELYLNGEFHLPPELIQAQDGVCHLTLGVRSEPPTAPGLDSLVNQLSRRFRYVLIELAIDRPAAPWIFELLQRCDLGYLFLRATTEDVYHLDVISRAAKAVDHGRMPPLKPIGCLAEREQVDGFDLLAQAVGTPLHMFIHDCPFSGFDGMERGSGLGRHSQSPMANGQAVVTGVDGGRTGSRAFQVDVRRLAREI